MTEETGSARQILRRYSGMWASDSAIKEFTREGRASGHVAAWCVKVGPLNSSGFLFCKNVRAVHCCSASDLRGTAFQFPSERIVETSRNPRLLLSSSVPLGELAVHVFTFTISHQPIGNRYPGPSILSVPVPAQYTQFHWSQCQSARYRANNTSTRVHGANHVGNFRLASAQSHKFARSNLAALEVEERGSRGNRGEICLPQFGSFATLTRRDAMQTVFAISSECQRGAWMSRISNAAKLLRRAELRLWFHCGELGVSAPPRMVKVSCLHFVEPKL